VNKDVLGAYSVLCFQGDSGVEGLWGSLSSGSSVSYGPSVTTCAARSSKTEDAAS